MKLTQQNLFSEVTDLIPPPPSILKMQLIITDAINILYTNVFKPPYPLIKSVMFCELHRFFGKTPRLFLFNKKQLTKEEIINQCFQNNLMIWSKLYIYWNQTNSSISFQVRFAINLRVTIYSVSIQYIHTCTQL